MAGERERERRETSILDEILSKMNQENEAEHQTVARVVIGTEDDRFLVCVCVSAHIGKDEHTDEVVTEGKVSDVEARHGLDICWNQPKEQNRTLKPVLAVCIPRPTTLW